MTVQRDPTRVNGPLRPPSRSTAPDPAGGTSSPAAAAKTPAWPSFTGTAQKVGTSSTGVAVYVDASLGAQALTNAQDLLADADRVVQRNNGFFGITGGPVGLGDSGTLAGLYATLSGDAASNAGRRSSRPPRPFRAASHQTIPSTDWTPPDSRLAPAGSPPRPRSTSYAAVVIESQRVAEPERWPSSIARTARRCRASASGATGPAGSSTTNEVVPANV